MFLREDRRCHPADVPAGRKAPDESGLQATSAEVPCRAEGTRPVAADPTWSLAERVSVLEVRMDSITEIALRAERKADTSMGRQDFLAENLIEVRKTVTRIDETVQGHTTILQEHGTMLREQGDLLREILRKLDER